ncbi:MAG: adenosylmethionine--8-amino-7-oxononanoate transaminase [bacterium]|nr:adenosylmethionine--8-amino-7-oxononanoate transaminase [bacterium]
MQEHQKDDPVIIESAEGCILKDVQGREYIDGISSLWTNVHGHRHKRLDAALKAQVDKIAHSTLLGLSNVPALECAKKLVDITPKDLTRVFYSDNGATSVEIALKIAYQYQQQAPEGDPKKNKFISMKNAYHGDTIGSVSLGGIDLFHEIFGALLFDSIKVESPHCYRCPFGKERKSCSRECFDHLEQVLTEHAHEAAAFVIEPLVQGAAGIVIHPRGFLKRAQELCHKHNIILVLDEVAVGFGKTGKLFACEHEDVQPDILALAKGISGGYLPLAATLTSEKIYRGFLAEHAAFKAFYHGHTYTGNPLACAVSIASIDVFKEEQVMETLAPKIDRFTERLKEFYTLPYVGDIRQQGIMIGIELVANRETKESFSVEERVGHRVILEARKKGLLIRPLGDVIILMPPLSISMEEIDKICDITFDAVKTVTAPHPPKGA